ncbi:helix-turn-helix transcriptional regulator [bacterium]|nr:helix-turn-helix transcriptional regulator [bacterium]
MLILSALGEGKKHGYELALNVESRSDGFFKFKHGTLYPILHKLEAETFIKGAWKEEASLRKRKYYTLTPKGRRRLSVLQREWQEFHERLMAVSLEEKP